MFVTGLLAGFVIGLVVAALGIARGIIYTN